jgi:RHS repeat-associated protein
MTKFYENYHGRKHSIRKWEKHSFDKMNNKPVCHGDAYYYHYDGIGSTVAITDANENIVNSYAYGIFGQILDSNETISNPFKYVGAFGVMDEGNGTYYMTFRYYDPHVGRFISKDPIGLAGGINMYSYVGNNPINYIDPLGLWWEFNFGGAIGGIDISTTVYNSAYGMIPYSSPAINVTPTFIGFGIQIAYGEGDHPSCSEDDVFINYGLGSYLGYSHNINGTVESINIGPSIGLPGPSTSIKNFGKTIGELLKRAIQ